MRERARERGGGKRGNMRDSNIFIFLECHVLIKSSQSTDAYGTILLLNNTFTYGAVLIITEQ